MTMRTLLCACLLLASCGGANAPSIPMGTTIPTMQGSVLGASDGTTRAFLGIPYAAPPVGALRFRPPQPAPAWSGTKPATKLGPACPQIKTSLQGGGFDSTTNEDCLVLNVWTPNAPQTLKPVMVFIHGGGFVLGSGGDPLYDGTNLSHAGDVVVVTLNYRLGPLGFLAHPALDSEDPNHATSGNYGILDQRMALQWVHDNIANFGGDPANVTLFGESAVGNSVCVHLVSPGSKGLFQRAIVESGFCTVANFPTRDLWELQGTALSMTLGCAGDAGTVRDCLRSKSAEQVLEALPLRTELIFGAGVSWNPIVDGVDVPMQIQAAFKAGATAHVPLLVGANSDEGTLFFSKVFGAMIPDDASFRSTLSALYTPAQVDSILMNYSSSKDGSAQQAAIHFLGDAVVCDAKRVARLQTMNSDRAYLYYFTHPFAWIVPNLGAFHSAELPFVFDNPYTFIGLKPDEVPLSQAMQGYWTRFAASAEPNANAGSGAIAWPVYSVATDPYLQLDLTIQAGTGLRKDACAFID